jgi:hypothetical protein
LRQQQSAEGKEKSKPKRHYTRTTHRTPFTQGQAYIAEYVARLPAVETLGNLMGRYCATSGPQYSSLIFNSLGGIKRLNTPLHICRSGFGSLFMGVFDSCDSIY